METQISDAGDSITKIEKDKIRLRYEKKQVNLELTFEAASNLLFFVIESDTGLLSAQIKEAVLESKDSTMGVLERVITTPIVASACSSMFPVFIESLFQILPTYGNDFALAFLTKIFSFIELQLTNMEKLIGTSNFDDISDVEAAVKKRQDLTLAETEDRPDLAVADLREQDQASVVFGKIAFYSDIL